MGNQDIENLDRALSKTLETSDISGLATDLSEAALDSILNDSLLRDLPIVGAIVSGAKLGLSVRDHFLLKKVLNFLTQTAEIPVEEREKFIRKVESSDSYNNRVGQALIMIIDKFEDLTKPRLLAHLLKATIRGEINYETFLRLSFSLERVFLPDLSYLEKYENGETIPQPQLEELNRAGLLLRTAPGDVKLDNSNEFSPSENGTLLMKILNK